MKTILKTVTLCGVMFAGVPLAHARGGLWSFSAFQPQTFEVGMATDKHGHKMRVLRMKDGTMMAVVPAEPLFHIMSYDYGLKYN